MTGLEQLAVLLTGLGAGVLTSTVGVASLLSFPVLVAVGSGVMMMAVLGLGTDLEFRIVNALKTLAVLAANVVATVIFVVVADLDRAAVGLLAAGSVVGGYVGSRIGRRLPQNLLRGGVVLAGLVAAVTML